MYLPGAYWAWFSGEGKEKFLTRFCMRLIYPFNWLFMTPE